MSTEPVRWWLCDLREDATPGGHLVPGRNRRAALAEFRRDMVVHFEQVDSHRGAVDRTRALAPVIIDGPLTPQEAFSHATGWAWAWAIHDQTRVGTILAVPAGAVHREEAVRWLGAGLTGRIERRLAADYDVAEELCRPV